jgi:DNA polymerase III alpha subunit
MLTRTEYSFKDCFGPIKQVVANAKDLGFKYLAICDANTFGHVQFYKECIAAEIEPMFAKEVKIDGFDLSVKLIARNQSGLSEMNKTDKISVGQVFSDDVVVLIHNTPYDWINAKYKYADLYLGNEILMDRSLDSGLKPLLCSDVKFPRLQDEETAELLGVRLGVHPQYLMTQKELFKYMPFKSYWDEVYELCKGVKIPQAQNLKLSGDLESLTRAGIPKRFPNGFPTDYEERLKTELGVIAEKEFESYFLMVADLISWAKTKMLVGPGRGSSAGSLVCYLLGITELDPIKEGLLFERFVDVTRIDLPDIDTDFQGTEREQVFEYLQNKYGKQNVSRLGNVSRLKPKSILAQVARLHKGQPRYENHMKHLLYEIRDSMIERSSGDARAGLCLLDSLESLKSGRDFMAEYPGLNKMAELEGHASHTSVHAAAVLICANPITDYASVSSDGVAQIDKKDAEILNLMKLDALGLKTLDIVADTLKMVGKTVEDIDIHAPEVYELLNSQKLTGIFQLEGDAARQLMRQINMRGFDDIVAVSAMARPGPLQSGGASKYIAVRDGREEPEYHHEIHKRWTQQTEGVVVYQEQILFLGRDMGKLGWPELTALRRAMSKSLGKEYFDKFRDAFLKGAGEQDISIASAEKVWNSMLHAGSYAFVKAHSASYSVITAWTAWLKANHPLEFACANIKFADADGTMQLLRELVKEGYKYTPLDPKKSLATWSVQDGAIIGGLTALKGVGPKTAEKIIKEREAGKMSARSEKLLAGESEFAEIYPFTKKYKDYYDNPEKYKISMPLSKTSEIQGDGTERIILAELLEKNIRDMMETGNLVKFGIQLKEGEVVPDRYWINFTVRDDEGLIMCTINRKNFERIGRKLLEEVAQGATLLIKGREGSNGIRKIYVEKWKEIK